MRYTGVFSLIISAIVSFWIVTKIANGETIPIFQPSALTVIINSEEVRWRCIQLFVILYSSCFVANLFPKRQKEKDLLLLFNWNILFTIFKIMREKTYSCFSNSLINLCKAFRFTSSMSLRNCSMSSIRAFNKIIATSMAWFLDPKTFSSTFLSIHLIRSLSTYTLDFAFSLDLALCFIFLQFDRNLYKDMCFNMKHIEAHASIKRGDHE